MKGLILTPSQSFNHTNRILGLQRSGYVEAMGSYELSRAVINTDITAHATRMIMWNVDTSKYKKFLLLLSLPVNLSSLLISIAQLPNLTGTASWWIKMMVINVRSPFQSLKALYKKAARPTKRKRSKMAPGDPARSGTHAQLDEDRSSKPSKPVHSILHGQLFIGASNVQSIWKELIYDCFYRICVSCRCPR